MTIVVVLIVEGVIVVIAVAVVVLFLKVLKFTFFNNFQKTPTRIIPLQRYNSCGKIEVAEACDTFIVVNFELPGLTSIFTTF